ncbi:MAG: VOC family protein [Actinobacteria bacterium]|nr:VOC family protein [Actinomycetota bacterium]
MSPLAKPRTPRFNHVAMSLPADMLDEEHRGLITKFYEEVFGWKELPTMTQDKHRLVLSCYTYEQFVFLIADEPHMTCARLDHYGMSVAGEDELDEILEKAKAFQEKDDRVKIIDKSVDDYDMLAITNIYIGYLLPMMVEIQWWNFKTDDYPAATA